MRQTDNILPIFNLTYVFFDFLSHIYMYWIRAFIASQKMNSNILITIILFNGAFIKIQG